jgi:hypothetical protein
MSRAYRHTKNKKSSAAGKEAGKESAKAASGSVEKAKAQLDSLVESHSDDFNAEVFEALARDLKSGRLRLKRPTLSDNIVRGLRAIIRSTGIITYHVYYQVGDDSPFLKIGVHDPGNPEHLTVTQARHIARTIKALGKKGIDVQEGLHGRLVRELQEQGDKWRP